MNSDFIHLYLDRSYKHLIPENVKQEISIQIGDSEPDRSKLSFCGFVFKDHEVHVFMPRGCNITETSFTNIELARLLFKCLSKYCRRQESFLQKEGKSLVIGNSQILPLILEILNDYKKNGIYTCENSFYRKGFQGKTDWNKTLNSVKPHIQDEEIIYPHFINRFTNSFFVNEVTKIHYSILMVIKNRFGWLLPEIDGFFFNQRNRISDASFDIGIIKAELQSVFDDSKLHTLRLLLRFLENDFKSGESDSITYGFSDFQYVWEDMLRTVLSPTHTFADLPVPTYQEFSGKLIAKPQKGQRLDILLYEYKVKKVCVIDAKYYDGSSIDSAPGWPDLVKQFFYAKSLTAASLKTEVISVKNYFIFPGVPKNTSPETIFVDSSKGHLNTDFPPIKCLHVSPEKIIESYISNMPNVELRNELFS